MEIVVLLMLVMMVLGYGSLLAYQARAEVRVQRERAEVARARLRSVSARW